MAVFFRLLRRFPYTTEAGKGDELRLGERKGEGEDLRTPGGVLRNRRR